MANRSAISLVLEGDYTRSRGGMRGKCIIWVCLSVSYRSSYLRLAGSGCGLNNSFKFYYSPLGDRTIICDQSYATTPNVRCSGSMHYDAS